MSDYTRKRKLNTLGSFSGRKSGSKVYYTSPLERSVLYLLEYAPQVGGYAHRPFVIELVLSTGEIVDYAPNFVLKRASRTTSVPILLTCFDARVWNSERTIALGNAIAQWAEENNHDMVTLSSDIFDIKGLLYNIKLLWKYKDTAPNPIFIQECRALLRRNPDGMAFDQLASTVGAHGGVSDGLGGKSAYPYIYNLIFRHILETDITVPLSGKSPIFLEELGALCEHQF